MKGGVLVENRSGQTIDEVASSEKRFIPKPQKKRRLGKEGQPCFNKVTMLSFSNPILLRRMRTRHPMRYTNTLKILV